MFMGIYKIEHKRPEDSTSRTMNLKLCKFPRMHLARFRLVQRQSATATTHTCALSWQRPFNFPRCLFLENKQEMCPRNHRRLWKRNNYYFSFSHPQTPHCQCNWSCLRGRLGEIYIQKAFILAVMMNSTQTSEYSDILPHSTATTLGLSQEYNMQ